MTAFHPTSLTLFAEHCGRALDYREAGLPYDRSAFAQGIAAHAVLEAIGTNPGAAPEEVGDGVALRLSGVGRSFDGVPEPPLPVEAVLDGVKLGLRWHVQNPVPAGARYEVGLACDRDFKPVDYEDERAAFRVILDVVDRMEEEDEESSLTVCVVRDYKSSWRDRQDALDTLQRRAQAVLAHACGLADGCDVLRLEVSNLRIGTSYARDLVLAESEDLLAGWRRDLLRAHAAASQRGPDGRRPASPGPRCVGCPYVLPCEARASLPEGDVLFASPETLARRYSAKLAEAKALEATLRTALGRERPAEVDGFLVGYVPRDKRELTATAYAELWDRWAEGDRRDARGLLKAVGLSVAAIERAARILFGTGLAFAADRRAWIDTLTTSRRTARFGIARAGATAPEEDDHGEE